VTTQVDVVCGAQFGSEGKGAIAAHLTRNYDQHGLAIRVAGPNAGHTAYDASGREWKLRTVPVAAVTSKCHLYIAPGSEIDPEVLFSELAELDEAGHDATKRLSIHPSATMLEVGHKHREAQAGLVGRVGSTGKGIGAARADRIMRVASTWGQFADDIGRQELTLPIDRGAPQWEVYDQILVEGTQGYGLGLHTEFYPQVTSSDCRAVDFLAMAGISPWARDIRLTVHLVARVYPIRVAGNSGPLLGETTWGDLGLPEERTTVTNKIRRVGEWDEQLVRDAIRANGGGDFHPDVHLALTMLDQKFPDLRDQTELTEEAETYLEGLEDSLGSYILLVGTGPNTVVER
jgi:adenylosuccinate synthase